MQATDTLVLTPIGRGRLPSDWAVSWDHLAFTTDVGECSADSLRKVNYIVRGIMKKIVANSIPCCALPHRRKFAEWSFTRWQ